MIFEQFSKKQYSLEETLGWLKDNQIDSFEELVFFPSFTHLKASISSTRHSSADEIFFQQLFSHYRLVARTIDGDHLFANEKQVILLPRSHLPNEVLSFPDIFSHLLIKYANSLQSITSFFSK